MLELETKNKYWLERVGNLVDRATKSLAEANQFLLHINEKKRFVIQLEDVVKETQLEIGDEDMKNAVKSQVHAQVRKAREAK